MYIAITTKYHGPTNTKGSRITAHGQSGQSITVALDHRLNSDENHAAAAEALARKLGWFGTYYGGSLEKGCAFVRVIDDADALPDAPGRAAFSVTRESVKAVLVAAAN